MEVVFSRKILKEIGKIPPTIRLRVDLWITEVERFGIDNTRLRRGWKDHHLIGNRKGQRAVYLNRSWRLIYHEVENGLIIIEIHKHAY